ncbi:MAG: GAF domain-containing protein, partial [Bacteroidales bacterium]|nr:GAF domain-containing protein [Bacteroidales bacterium]
RLNMLELERNNWYQSGVTDFTLLLQQDFKSTEEMAYPVIKKLAEHLRAEQAGIFVLKEKGDKELLILEAAYAYDKKKQLDTEIEIGESLVGKCAKEQKLIRIDDLPEGYTYISSGLGEDTPSSLILMPLIYEKKIFGVIEMASLKRITDYRVNFLNVIAERIAAEISNINTKILTTKLAEDSQKQTEELAIKEKQSEKIISALSKEKEQLNFKLNKLSENFELINTIIPKIIFNTEGTISEINKAAKTLYGFKVELNSDKKTANIFEKNEKFQEIFKKVLSGETMINRYFRNNNTEELFEKFIPVKNSENKVETIILIAVLIKTP